MPAKDPGIRHYRIGEYAQKMGVTPDLLKHYEKMRLIQAYTTPSGYRYYPFHESLALLQCMALRNYGIPLQEMDKLLHQDDLAAFHQALEQRVEAIGKHLLLEQAVIEDYRRFSQWMDRMENRDSYVLIEEKEEMLFLPHSKRHDFLEDDRIQAILSDWVAWMPMVKSCRLIPTLSGHDPLQEASWGLTVSASFAETYRLPVNEAVKKLPGGRMLMFHYRAEHQPKIRNAAWQLMRNYVEQSSLRLMGPIQQVALANLRIGGQGISCGWFAIHVEE
ncbi:MAG: MerR family transcriptional regulator [Clostridia bacterium]|nr:MerR family transcriptional regulator [Clostridia bacterium]